MAAHLAIATLLCQSLVKDPAHVSAKVWARLLNQIRVDSTLDLAPLCALVKQAQACAVDATAVTAIGKFAKALHEVLEDDADAAGGSGRGCDEDNEDEDLEGVDGKIQGLEVKDGDEDEHSDDDGSSKKRADKASKGKPRATPLSPSLMHQVKQRSMGEDVALGGLFGHDEVPTNKTDKRATSKRGAAARRALQDEDDAAAPGGMLSPHSPLRVRRSARATKAAVSAVKKEVDLDKLLEQQEKKEKVCSPLIHMHVAAYPPR